MSLTAQALLDHLRAKAAAWEESKGKNAKMEDVVTHIHLVFSIKDQYPASNFKIQTQIIRVGNAIASEFKDLLNRYINGRPTVAERNTLMQRIEDVLDRTEEEIDRNVAEKAADRAAGIYRNWGYGGV